MTNSDIIIMIPVEGIIKDLPSVEDDEVGRIYIQALDTTSKYECNSTIVNSIERKSLGKAEIAYLSDEYDFSKIKWIECSIIYSYQKISNLGVLQIIIQKCTEEDSQIGDIVSSNNISMKLCDRELSLNQYIEYLKLGISGEIRCIYCNDIKEKDENQLKYLLAGETAQSEHSDYKISEAVKEDLGKDNLAKYDFYELYASTRAIVYFLMDYSDENTPDYEREALLLFICEIAILQNAAISRINRQIVDELLQNSSISSRKTLKLQTEFGKTVLLWDNSVFNYYLAQELSDNIVKAFNTDRLMEEYKRNSKHIEHIASLKNGIAADVEAKILNIIAFILSISQLIELIRGIAGFVKGKEVVFGAGGVGVLLLIVVILIINKRRKR